LFKKKGNIYMRLKRQHPIFPQAAYLEKAKTLSAQDAELLNQRMLGIFARRREDRSRNAIEIRALQMAFEDEQLHDWRLRLASIRETATLT
jgi:hypothetical protein